MILTIFATAAMMNDMNRAQILAKYPNASESTIRANLCESTLNQSEVDMSSVKPKALVMRASTDESKLNRLEKSWLSSLRMARYPWIGIQSFTFKLADDCRYTPDFMTIDELGCLTAWECKGFMRDDARVKLRVAARQFPFIKFVLVTKAGGTFKREEVKP